MARSTRAAAIADLTLVVLDRSRDLDGHDQRILIQTVDTNRLIVENKSDLPAAEGSDPFPHAVLVSAATGAGFAELRRRIAAALDVDLIADRPSITNVRHIALVQRAHDALARARSAALSDGGLPEEFVLADLQEARDALEQVNGQRTSDEVLAHIFSRFCVGK
jgi:tRNA modification GTPase